MRIAFLGWGSLTWDKKCLKVARSSDGVGWYKDGPFLPIEFARISRDGRLTLVLYSEVEPVQVLWCYTDVDNLNDAIENLRNREGASKKNIGFYLLKDNTSRCNVVSSALNEIKKWAVTKDLDAVVWTDLPEKFKINNIIKEFNGDNVIEYLLHNLKGDRKLKAKEYIEKAPEQVITKIRKRVEKDLGWLCVNHPINQDSYWVEHAC